MAANQVGQEVRDARCPWYPRKTFKSKQEVNDFRRVYNDGRRIYVNRLIFYPKESYRPHMISFNQLFLKDIGIEDCKKYENTDVWRRPEVQCACFHTMVYDESMLAPLIKCGIPITVFKDRNQQEKGPLVEEDAT